MNWSLPSLPVDAVVSDLSAALQAHSGAVLIAPPGSGKTTRVPLALLEAGWLGGRGIVLLEPRRLAATNAARYMAGLLGEPVGATVGYTIRYEQCRSRRTRLEAVTEGILTRRLQADPELTGIGLVILDEFHERSLQADLALALCRDAQQGLGLDLRLLVMSATLDAAPVAALLGGVPVLRCAGRSHPVTICHLPHDPVGPHAAVVAAGVRRAVRECTGDILAFLPGAGEIRACAGLLSGLEHVDLRPLYGELPFAAQEQALLPGERRRVVLATNVAETSLTIDGITAVVDGGFERRPRFDPVASTTQLELTRISRASAEQRAGRAGRLGPGTCYRLWSRGTHGALLPAAPSEISQADLAPLAMELALWGATVANALPWLDSPPAGALAAAHQLLRLLDLLDDRRQLTVHGRIVAGWPLHPRLGALLIAARDLGQPGLGCDLVALLSERDLCPQGWVPELSADSDLVERLERLHRGQAEPARLAAVRRAAAFWRHQCNAGRRMAGGYSPELVNRLLAAAFPDRIGMRRVPNDSRYLLASGRGARLGTRSAVPRPEFLVAAALRRTTESEAEIMLAGSLTREDLEAACRKRLRQRREVGWDAAAERLVGRELRKLGDLTLEERPSPVADAEAVPLLLELLRREGLNPLGWPARAVQLRARLSLLHRAIPEGGWPEVGDAALLEQLETWLAPWLPGVRCRQELARLDLVAILGSWLGRKASDLERLAPERLAVPSGSLIRLDYAAGDVPVLAVKLQELFGLADTPRIADGRVPVLIHLLSPAGRPLAVTADLRSFWDKIYPDIRKEMRGRYPKHPWPEDPWRAEPTRRAKPR